METLELAWGLMAVVIEGGLVRAASARGFASAGLCEVDCSLTFVTLWQGP